MSGTRQLAAIAMVAVLVLAGGCAGWGTDGPDDEADADDAGGDLEKVDGEAEADEGDDDPEGGDSNDTDGAAVDENEAENGSDGDEEGSDGDETDAGTTGGDQDKQTEDSGSSDSDSEQDQDGEKDTDESEEGDQDEEREADEKKETDENGESDQDKEQDSQDETHTLRVGLIDATATGPITGTVTVDGETKEATPDEPAEFELEDGTYTVSGEYEEGWHVQSKEIEIDGEDVETNLHTVPVRTLTVETGEPDVDVTVERDDGETLSGTTGEDGTVTFETIPGSHTIDADGYERTQFTVPADFDPDPVVLEPTDDDDGDETHTLTVTVTDPDGEPVTDETVHILTYDGGADVASAPTDDDGTAQFDLGNGEYEVAVSAPDRELHQPSDQRLVTIDGADEGFNVQLEPSGSDGDESDTATGIVRVVDKDDEPVEGEPVILSPPGTVEDEAKEERETNADGEVVIELAAGDPSDAVMYGVEVRDQEQTLGIMSDEHHGVQEVTFIVDTSDDDDDDPETYTLTITNAGESTIEITPEDGQNDGESITVEPSDGVAEVDVEPGSYSIATDERWGAEISVTEDTEILLQHDDPEPITVEVINSETGEPVEGAEFSGVCNWYYTAGDALVTGESDADGFAELQAEAAPTTCETNVNADGYEETVVEISVPDDDGRTIELEPDSQMTQFETTIVVENEQGQPIEGKVVEARTRPGDGEWEEIGTTNENGEVVLTGQSSDPTDVIQFEVRVQGHEEEVVQTYVDDSEHEEMIVIEADGGNNGDYDTCDDFESHAEAQSYFEEDPRDSERSARDGDNDGIACETLADDPDDAKAIVIVEDQDGNPVEGVTVGIGDDTAVTNKGGVASVGYDDFDDPDEQRTLDVAVLEQKTQMTIEPGEHNDPLEERSNIEEITVESAASQGSLTTVAA